MLKRVFYTGLGLGAGAVAGVYVVRKVEATRRKLTPEHLAARAGAGAGSLGERLRSAVAEGRAAADAREAELRAGYQQGGSGGVATPGGGAAEWDSPGRGAPPRPDPAVGTPESPTR